MKQVLIIDDSAQIRERIADLLSESPGIRIIGEAGTAREALDAVQRRTPDAVILDLRLPDKSGIFLLKTFKKHHPEIAVTVLTNLDDARYRKQCLDLGADHFLSKTREFEKIVDTIVDNPAR